MVRSLVSNVCTRKVPATDAAGRQMPSTPETRPRWPTGTWSGSTATWAASSALRKTCAMHHPTSTTAMFGARATVRMPVVPPTSPTTIQGRRMPHRDVVRSLSRPKNGLLTIDSSDPTPVTRARFLGASSRPTRWLTFSASDTSSGARKSSAPPAYDRAYSEMNVHPTRAAVAGRSW